MRQRLHQHSLSSGQIRALRAAVRQDFLEPEAAAVKVGIRFRDIDFELMQQLREDFALATSILRGDHVADVVSADDSDWRVMDRIIQQRESLLAKWSNGNNGETEHRIIIEFV